MLYKINFTKEGSAVIPFIKPKHNILGEHMIVIILVYHIVTLKMVNFNNLKI